MLKEILLPQLGQTMEEGTVETWHKAEGDPVEKGEVIYELTTDKATLEVESFIDGILLKILVPEGETVPVNELVAICGDEGDKLPDDIEAYRAEVMSAAGVEAATKAVQPAAAAAATTAVEAPTAPAARRFSSPRARKIAAEQKVPIAVLRGSGPDGRIIERDVRAYLEKSGAVKATPAAREAACQAGVDLLAVKPSEPGARITKEDVAAAAAAPKATAMPGERIPLSAMRQTIARRMTEIKQTVPHFYLLGSVRMGKAMARRKALNAEGGPKITVTHMLVRAAALALQAHPKVNARFDGDAIALNPAVNVGVAVAVEDGLFVPVLHKADTKTLAQLAVELKGLAEAALAGKLRPEQYEGGCITISNLGMFGVDGFVPIINTPESCILGIGKAAEQVVVEDGAMRIELVMSVSLAADHRVVDGAQAAEFLATFRGMLEEPDQL